MMTETRDNIWRRIQGKHTHKYHLLRKNQTHTLCNIHISHLSKHKFSNIPDFKKCKICISVLNTYQDQNNQIIHDSVKSNSYFNKSHETFTFKRTFPR